jgi:uncharacterized protein (DUF1810 family)
MTQAAASTDPFHLQRFVDAQAGVYAGVLAELRAGCKSSHWMWFIFPQLQGLGRSSMARHYAIASLAEARAYLAHPILGPRLRECVALVNQVAGKSLLAILGSPDDLKFRSSMTLFAHAAPDQAVFRAALAKYCGGQDDAATLARL